MKRALIAMGMALCFFGQVQAQNDDFGDDFKEDFESFRRAIHKDFNNFRKKINKEYAEFLKNPWEEFTEKKPLVIPKEDDVPPVIYPEEERDKPFPAPEPLPYDVVIPVPKPAPQPKPVEPIKENPEPMPKVDFLWFGTKLSVRFDTSSALQMTGAREDVVSAAWLELSGQQYTNLVYDCLQLRTEYKMGDWAYLEMLQAVAEKLFGEGTNESVLLMAYLYCQSGYKMRLARDDSGILHMLFASRHIITTYRIITWEVRGSILMGSALRAYISVTMHFRGNRACPFGSLHLQGWLCLPHHHGRVNPSVIRR